MEENSVTPIHDEAAKAFQKENEANFNAAEHVGMIDHSADTDLTTSDPLPDDGTLDDEDETAKGTCGS